MNTMEDRIRSAARAAAGTVPPDGVPPLRLPPGRAHRRARLFDSSWARRLTPLAAAAAVVVVVVAIVTVSGTGHTSTGRTGAPGKVTPAASYVASGLIPSYYVALAADQASSPSYAVVRATATGAMLATITAPDHDGTFVAVTAAADDRTFVLDEQPFVAAPGQVNQVSQARTFFLLRLATGGAEASLTRLAALAQPKGSTVTGLALSPDGSRLAVAVQHGNISEHGLQQLRLYTLATGTVRTWSATGMIGYAPDGANVLSWTGNGRTLAFDWYGAGQAQTRLLEVVAPGDNLLTDSQPADLRTGQGWACESSALVTPDGKTVVCGARPASARSISNDRVGYVGYSAATGKITHILDQRLAGPQGPELEWTNSSGSVLIGDIEASPNSAPLTFGVITQSRFVSLPWSPKQSVANVAW